MEEFHSPAGLKELRALRAFVAETGQRLGIPAAALEAFSAALSELASNVVQHPEPPATEFRLKLERVNGESRALLRCDANSFADRNALFCSARPDEHITSDAISGRGLYIAICLFPFLGYTNRTHSGDGYEHYLLTWPAKRKTPS